MPEPTQTHRRTHMIRRLRFAQLSSLACAVHCVAAPFVVIFFPFIGDFFHNVFIEIGILLFSISFGIAIIYAGFCQHKKMHSLLLFAIGALFWTLHLLTAHLHLLDINTSFLLISGSLFVLGSYYFNHRDLKCCPSRCCSDH